MRKIVSTIQAHGANYANLRMRRELDLIPFLTYKAICYETIVQTEDSPVSIGFFHHGKVLSKDQYHC